MVQTVVNIFLNRFSSTFVEGIKYSIEAMTRRRAIVMNLDK